MVISAMRKKKSSAFKHSVRKLLSGKALELQSQRSGESRPGNNIGWGTPRRQGRGAQPSEHPGRAPVAAASCHVKGGIKTDHSGGRKSQCFSKINKLSGKHLENQQAELYQTKQLLPSKRISQQNEKAIYRMEENICTSIFDKGLSSKIGKTHITQQQQQQQTVKNGQRN